MSPSELVWLACKIIGLTILIYAVGVVMFSFFAKEPDHEVDIRSPSTQRLKNQIRERTELKRLLKQGHKNASHPRR